MSQSHHHHHHSHGPLEPHPRGTLAVSLLRMSVPARLGAAALVAASLWLAILWALA